MNPIVLTLASSDPSGGAGLQADLKTFQAFGAYGMSVVTGLTAGNTEGVRDVFAVDASFIDQQIALVIEDILPHGIKTGFFLDSESIGSVVRRLRMFSDIPLVVDPVLSTKRGDQIAADMVIQALIDDMIPLAHLITPNLKEAELLTGISVEDERSLKKAVKRLLSLGCESVLITSCNLIDDENAVDYFADSNSHYWFSAPKLQTTDLHGTGDTLSAAITILLAQGIEIRSAIQTAKSYVHKAIQSAPGLGRGLGPLNHRILYESIRES
tara:strand:- start:2028 stop:2834 length:807 start_codon:yes stop_codon:yes gene_type:complete